MMSDVICEVCWTTSWQPVEEGTKNAVPDKTTNGWMQCGRCVLQDANAALTERVRVLETALEYVEQELSNPYSGKFTALQVVQGILHSPPAQAGQAEGG